MARGGDKRKACVSRGCFGICDALAGVGPWVLSASRDSGELKGIEFGRQAGKDACFLSLKSF